MPGMRMDGEVLLRHARRMHEVGAELAGAPIQQTALPPDPFGVTADSYSRRRERLLAEHARLAEALIEASENLRAVVDSHTDVDQNAHREV